MSPKVAKFFPLSVAALMVFREFTSFIFIYRFDIGYYIQENIIGWNFYRTCEILFFLTLKFGIFLGNLATYKMLSDGRIRIAKMLTGLSFGTFIFSSLMSFLFGIATHWSPVPNIVSLLLVVLVIMSTVIVLIVREPFLTSVDTVSPHVVIPPVPLKPQVQLINHSTVQSVPDQLAALKKMHKSGDLTDAEFMAAKKKILE